MDRTVADKDGQVRSRRDSQSDGERATGASTAAAGPVRGLHRAMGNQSVGKLQENGDLHPKLAVGTKTDAAEREAERVADEVVRKPAVTANPRIRRESNESGTATVDSETESRIRSATSGGRRLPNATRSYFESQFDRDFSDVRIHTDGRAGGAARSINAEAFTLGTDIAFAPGKYRPHSPSGRELLAHELTHVVQQGNASRVIQRREYPPDTDAAELGPGDWTTEDRQQSTSRWAEANEYNLEHQRNEEYQRPVQRRDFYLWYYNWVVKKHDHEVRWPLAAYLVAKGAADLSRNFASGVTIQNPVQEAALKGNQLIFDDVFPKLKELANRPDAVVDEAAKEWDAKTLSEEQMLVQSMYEDLDESTVERFGSWAKQEGAQPAIGYTTGRTMPQEGPYHEQKPVPPFAGDISDPDDRYQYGMHLGEEFSTLDVPEGTPSRPETGEEYQGDKRYEELDYKSNLHELDAHLDDVNADESAVVRALKSLNKREQQELGKSYRRIDALKATLTRSTLKKVLDQLEHVPEEVEQRLVPERSANYEQPKYMGYGGYRSKSGIIYSGPGPKY